MDDTRYHVLGEGSFGIVVGPALPNRNREGRTTAYPRNVTKIFKSTRNYMKAMRNAEQLRATVKRAEASAEPYRRRYRIRNLPESIRGDVSAYLRIPVGNDRILPMIRAPNLGFSIVDLYHPRTPEASAAAEALYKVPYQVLCAQMFKCMEVIQAICDAGYIHGDIRETNVMCDAETGRITIIDFDWLKRFDDFYRTFPTFFYCHPPECLFIWGRVHEPYYVGIESLRDDVKGNVTVYEWAKEKGDLYQPVAAAEGATHFAHTFVPIPAPIHGEPIPWNAFRKGLFDIATPSIDSYGLAFCFRLLLRHVWFIEHDARGNLVVPPIHQVALGPHAENNEEATKTEYERFLKLRRYIVETLLPRMGHSNYTKRWDIRAAIRDFDIALRRVKLDVLAWLPEAEDAVAVSRSKRIQNMTAEELEWMQQFANFEWITPATLARPSPSVSTNRSPSTFRTAEEALNQILDHVQESLPAGGGFTRRKTRRNKKRISTR